MTSVIHAGTTRARSSEPADYIKAWSPTIRADELYVGDIIEERPASGVSTRYKVVMIEPACGDRKLARLHCVRYIAGEPTGPITFDIEPREQVRIVS